MADNLRATKYNDGTDITYINSAVDWVNATGEGFCWHEHDEKTALSLNLGALYNWWVVETGKICPKGWSVPSREDWQELDFNIAANGGNYDGTTYDGDDAEEAASKIGSAVAATSGWDTETYYWYEPITGEGAVGYEQDFNNSSCFDALSADGRYMTSGAFTHLGFMANFWSSTEAEDDPGWAHFRYMFAEGEALYESVYTFPAGYSIRCLQD